MLLTISGTMRGSRGRFIFQSGMHTPWSSLRRCETAGSKPFFNASLTKCSANSALGRAVVFRADADAEGGVVVELEVRPVVGDDRDDDVRICRGQPPAQLLVGEGKPLFLVGGNGLPLPHQQRSVACRKGADQLSHRATAG